MNETIYVSVFTDDARVGLSLHVHAADQAKRRTSEGIRMNYRFVVNMCNL
jgi:hypothetical protein